MRKFIILLALLMLVGCGGDSPLIGGGRDRTQTYTISEGTMSFTVQNTSDSFTVASDVVQGTITVDYNNPQEISVSPLSIEVGNLAPGVITNDILRASENSTITLEPISVEGMPEEFDIGEEYTAALFGNLVIRGVRQQATFLGVMVPVSRTELRARFTDVVTYDDFGEVADETLEPEMTIMLSFTATADE